MELRQEDFAEFWSKPFKKLVVDNLTHEKHYF